MPDLTSYTMFLLQNAIKYLNEKYKINDLFVDISNTGNQDYYIIVLNTNKERKIITFYDKKYLDNHIPMMEQSIINNFLDEKIGNVVKNIVENGKN